VPPCRDVPYLTVLAIALHAWGALGAAVAWSLRVIGDAIALFSLDGGVSPLPNLVPLLLLAAVAVSVFGFPPGSTNRWVLGRQCVGRQPGVGVVGGAEFRDEFY
jgi:hypothetical protein